MAEEAESQQQELTNLRERISRYEEAFSEFKIKKDGEDTIVIMYLGGGGVVVENGMENLTGQVLYDFANTWLNKQGG